MQIGLSTYSLAGAIKNGQLTVVEAIQWIADNGGDFIEIVPDGFSLVKEPGLIGQIRERAADCGIRVAHYCVGAKFNDKTDQEWQREVDKVKHHVDIARELGATMIRHDAASRPREQCGLEYFEADLPAIVAGCCEIADYAAARGMTTSIENHGLYLEASERVRRVIRLVDRPNFKTTIDLGNFMFAGEEPLSAVQNNLPFANVIHLKDFLIRRPSVIHLKDFLIRRPSVNPGEGFHPLPDGRYYRHTLFGHGDLDVREIMRMIKQSGFSGLLSHEFNGIEDCLLASRIGLANARRMWEEA